MREATDDAALHSASRTVRGTRAGAYATLDRALRSEPWWLRGVTWPLVGACGFLAALDASWTGVTAFVPEFGKDAASPELALVDVVTNACVALAVLVLGATLVNLRRSRLPLPLALAIAVLLGTLVPFVAIASFIMQSPDSWLWAFLVVWRRTFVMWALAAAAWYFLQRATAREAALRAAELARRQLETGMLEARLQALQAQVEPHFLFNTLAHVKRLYRTDPLRARGMLNSFRGYLQSALPDMRDPRRDLGRELDLVRAYLDVEQVRMGRRLTVAIDVRDTLRQQAFPATMLISLVENAIKHGLNPLPEGGTISIEATVRDGSLEVAVVDTGQGIADKIGSGVGLANIRARLAGLFGPHAGLVLTPNAPRGLRAAIVTPLGEAVGAASSHLAKAVDVHAYA
ncbi:MAG: sensor histidine kinase [Rudaea sp.]